MPLTLRNTGMDGATRAKVAARTVEEARTQLEELQAEQARAEEEARAEAARVKRERDQARRQLQARLAALREEFARELPAPDRPRPTLRRDAREFLHPGPNSNPVTLLGVLAGNDALVALHHHRSQVAGRIMADAAASEVGGALVDEVDDLEVAAWGACMARVRELAGEGV